MINEPYNVIHELYRIVFERQKAQKEKEEQERLQAEEEARKQAEAEREAKRNNVPLMFAAKPIDHTPPTKPTQDNTPMPTMEDLEDLLEEVT